MGRKKKKKNTACSETEHSKKESQDQTPIMISAMA